MLARVPCPTVGLALEPPAPAGSRLAPEFDVLIEDAGDLAPVRASVQRCPLAAATLVQILRHGRTLELAERLVAESLAYSTLQAGPEFAAWLAARGVAPPRGDDDRAAVRALREGALRLTLDRRTSNAFEMRDALADGPVSSTTRSRGLSTARARLSAAGTDEFGLSARRGARGALGARARLLASARCDARGGAAPAPARLRAPAFCRVSAREDAFFQLPEVGMVSCPGGRTASIPAHRAPAHRLARPLGEPHRRCDGPALGARRRDRALKKLRGGSVPSVAEEESADDDTLWVHRARDHGQGAGGESRAQGSAHHRLRPR
jgi:hypothetical protein